MYKGKSHAEGGIPVVVDGNTNVEIEGNEYHLCRDAMSSAKIYSFKNKSNKEILDSIYSSEGCKFVQGIANSGDFIVCKLVVLDDDKRTITGTVKSIIDTMQSEKSCNVSEGRNKMEKGGGINECLSYLKTNKKNFLANGYYYEFKKIPIDIHGEEIPPQIFFDLSFVMIGYNSGGQKEINIHQTINPALVEQIQKLFNCSKVYANVIIDRYVSYGKKITESSFKMFEDKKMLITNRDEIVCQNVVGEMGKGGGINKGGNIFKVKVYLGDYSYDVEKDKETPMWFAKVVKMNGNDVYGILTEDDNLDASDIGNFDSRKKLNDYIRVYGYLLNVIIFNEDELPTAIYKYKDNYNESDKMEKGGSIEEHKETYEKWKSLVNMSKSELKEFYDSEEGKDAGLSDKESNDLGISNGRESARWIMRMKDTPVSEWTPKMWEWANKQISFISRMSGNKGSLYDENGNKTRKHTSLLIWGHNPKKMEMGGGIEFVPEKKGTLIRGNEIIKYAEKVNGNYRLVFYKIKESNGKVPILCDAFDYCHKLDTNDVSADELIELIKKNNLMEEGVEIKDLIVSKKVELNFYRTTPDHALEYGVEAENPLYLKNFHVTKTERLKGIGKKMLKYLDDYAIENGNDVIFGYINQKATFTKNKETNFNDTQLIKNWLHDNGYAVNDDDNNFHKVVGAKMKDGGGIIQQQGTLFTKDKTSKLEYKKVGNYYVFRVYNPKESQELKMSNNQFINYLHSELYIDDKMKDGGSIEYYPKGTIFQTPSGEIEIAEIVKEEQFKNGKPRGTGYRLKGSSIMTTFDEVERNLKKGIWTISMKDGGNVITYRNKFNKKYGFDANESHSLEEIAKLTSLKLSALQDIYNKGIGAYKTNPESVRPNVKSKEQWAMARVYSSVMGGKASKVDVNELERGKMQHGGEIDNLFELSIYNVIAGGNNDSDTLYYGTNLKDAEDKYDYSDLDDLSESDQFNGGLIELQKQTNTYKFVYELDKEYDEEISDYPIEEYYEDRKYYKLVEEGEFETIKEKQIVGTNEVESENKNKAIDLLDEVVSIFKKRYPRYTNAGYITKNSHYFLIPIDDTDKTIELRISDHSPNFRNIDANANEILFTELVKIGEEPKKVDRTNEDNYDVKALNENYVEYQQIKPKNRVALINCVIYYGKDETYKKFDKNTEYNVITEYFDLDNYDYDVSDIVEKIDELIEDEIYQFENGKNEVNVFQDGGNIPNYNIELLAPNGKKSNLTSKQWHIVRTPAFKQWFGDWEKLAMAKIKDSAMDEVTLANISKDVSKVVDENGEPLVVYHGGTSDFDKFDSNKIGYTDSGFYGYGFYFSPSSEIAELYGNAKPYFLKINNIYNCNKDNPFYLQPKSVTENYIDKGYEGSSKTLDVDKKYHEYCVFFAFPNDIKLADGRNTTFDGNNDDIRFDVGGVIENELSIIIKGVTNENKYKGNYKKIFDLIEKDLAFYNPYGTSFEELRDNDFYITITPKPESLIIDKISKLQGVEIVNDDIRYEDGGEVKLNTYQQRVNANLKHMSTEPTEWSAVPIIDFVDIEVEGKTKAMPEFSFPKGYTKAPTLFPNSQSGNMNCELCGRTPIKNAYYIQNDKKKFTLLVGSECVTHFGEGASGKQNLRQFKLNQAEILNNDFEKALEYIATNFSKLKTERLYNGGTKKTREWQQSAVSKAYDEYYKENVSELVKDGKLDVLFKKKDTRKEYIYWYDVFARINPFDNDFYEKERTDKDAQFLSWYKRNKESGEDILEAISIFVKATKGDTLEFDSLQNVDEFEYGGDIEYKEGGNIAPSYTLQTPSKEKSQLTYLQQILVRTKAFKDWFGDWEKAGKNFLNDNKDNFLEHYKGVSKAINMVTLEPLLTYHGTKVDEEFFVFNVFAKQNARPYAYFAYNEAYSYNFSRGKTMYKCFLLAKNPFMAIGDEYELKREGAEYWINTITETLSWDKYKKIVSNDKKQKLKQVVESQIGDYVRKVYDQQHSFWLLMARDTNSLFKAFLMSHGFTSVFYTEEINTPFDPQNPSQYTRAITIFNASDIKLGDGRNLNFDPMKNDIRYDKGGEIDKEKEDLPIKNEYFYEQNMELSKKEKLGKLLFGDKYRGN